MIIYRALFPNGKSYIGQTIYNLEKRKYEHKYSSEHGVKFVFYHAIRKYGFDSIEWSIIDTAETQEELNEKEKYWIKYYNTCIYNKNSNGYNSNFGGGSGSGYKHTKEAIEKIKLIHKGRKLSEESKEKIRKAHLGTKLSDEAKQKMSEVRKGEKHPLFGKHRTEEVKEKIKKTKTGNCLGEKNANAKITEDVVKIIKIRLANGDRAIDIVNDLNIKGTTIKQIKALKTWNYILPELNDKIKENRILKISEDLAKEIKIRLANGESVKNIKNELEISESNIKHIKYLDSWRDLLPELNNQLRK